MMRGSTQRLKKILQLLESQSGLRRLGPPGPWKVTLQMVASPEMTRLNRYYRGKNAPTDVLSFPAPSPFKDMGFLGDLVICTPVLKSQARALGHSPTAELDVLLVHGVLHLLGLDHETSPAEARKMARRESQILRLLRTLETEGTVKSKKSGAEFGLIDRVYSGIKKG